MAVQPNVLLDATNRAENALLVREMLTGVALAISLEESELNDALTAVTEACNNVVLHAYEGEEGPLEVEVNIAEGGLEVVVRDHGTGIQTREQTSEGSLGIGLPVIQALAQRMELRDNPRGGTEVWMEFAAPSDESLSSLLGAKSARLAPLAPTAPTGATIVSIAPIELARPVLPRILSTLAARAHFSTDRISDTQLVSDALIAHADGSFSHDHLSLAIAVEPRNLELHIGPLGAGRAQQLVSDSTLDGLGAVIERLTSRHSVTSVGAQETLMLELTDRR